MDENKEADEVAKLAGQIKQSFELDSVVVIATKTKNGQTNSYNGAAGNWFAIYGSVNDWVLRCDTRTINEVSNEE